MKLSVMDRMTIPAVLQGVVGGFEILKVVTDFRDQIGFTEEEHKVLKFRPREDGGPGTQWNTIPDKEFLVGPKAMEIVKDALEGLEKEKKLDAQTFVLYLRFVRGDKDGSDSDNNA